MELRRAADTLLRSQNPLFATRLNPSSTLRWTSKTQSSPRSCINPPIQRPLSTSSRRCAVRPIPVTTSAPRPSNESSSTESSQSTSSSPAPKPKNPMEALGAELGWTSRNKSPRSSTLPFATGKFERTLNGGSSASDILSQLKLKREERFQPGSGSSKSIDVSKMMDIPGTFGVGAGGLFPDGKSLTAGVHEDSIAPKPKRAPIKLGPSTGRSITIGATGIDVGRGFKLLEQSCARNKIKSDANKQRFHERGGLKRKRLRRERWRKKFLEGFKATVGRVKQLKNQGW